MWRNLSYTWRQSPKIHYKGWEAPPKIRTLVSDILLAICITCPSRVSGSILQIKAIRPNDTWPLPALQFHGAKSSLNFFFLNNSNLGTMKKKKQCPMSSAITVSWTLQCLPILFRGTVIQSEHTSFTKLWWVQSMEDTPPVTSNHNTKLL